MMIFLTISNFQLAIAAKLYMVFNDCQIGWSFWLKCDLSSSNLGVFFGVIIGVGSHYLYSGS